MGVHCSFQLYGHFWDRRNCILVSLKTTKTHSKKMMSNLPHDFHRLWWGLHGSLLECLKLPQQQQEHKHKNSWNSCVKSKSLTYSAFKFQRSFSSMMIRFLYIVVTEKDLIASIFHSRAEREQHQRKEHTLQIEFNSPN